MQPRSNGVQQPFYFCSENRICLYIIFFFPDNQASIISQQPSITSRCRTNTNEQCSFTLTSDEHRVHPPKRSNTGFRGWGLGTRCFGLGPTSGLGIEAPRRNGTRTKKLQTELFPDRKIQFSNITVGNIMYVVFRHDIFFQFGIQHDQKKSNGVQELTFLVQSSGSPLPLHHAGNARQRRVAARGSWAARADGTGKLDRGQDIAAP